MTAFHLVGRAATEPAFEDARAVLRQRGLVVADPDRADVIIGEVPVGVRAVPEDVIAAARGAVRAGVLLWTREAMVRPVVPVQHNVVLVAPVRRDHLVSAIEILLGPPAPSRATSAQSLHRGWWSGWVVGEDTAFDVAQNERDGATLLQAAAPRAELASSVLCRTAADAQRDALLRESFGRSHLIHLAPGASHWFVQWSSAAPLWLYSPLRIPARWSLSAAVAASGGGALRVAAFPGDVVVAAAVSDDDAVRVLEQLASGAIDVFRTLCACVRDKGQWGAVVEAR